MSLTPGKSIFPAIHASLVTNTTGHASVDLATHQLQEPCHLDTPDTGKERSCATEYVLQMVKLGAGEDEPFAMVSQGRRAADPGALPPTDSFPFVQDSQEPILP